MDWLISIGQIPPPTQVTGISGTIINPDTGEVLEGVRIPFVDADGNIVAATSGVDGNFQIETGAGTYTMNKVIFSQLPAIEMAGMSITVKPFPRLVD